MNVTMNFLKRKLSPDANPDQVDVLKEELENTDLLQYVRDYKGGRYIVLVPKEFFADMYGRQGNCIELRDLARCLQALYWERSAYYGNTVYIKELAEYESFGY